MLVLHSGNGPMGDLGDRFLSCFLLAADDVGLPADPDFRDALRAYMTWAVAEMISYPERDADIPRGRLVPHWSWDGLQD